MIERLFHGKSKDDGEWIEGSLIISDEQYFIVPIFGVKSIDNLRCSEDSEKQIMVFAIEVIPETVGQDIGFSDKNGKKIFEGDIIHYLYTPGEGFWNADEICEVKFEGTGFYIECIHNNRFAQHSGWLIQIPYGKDKSGNVGEFEVIGNVYDNRELLGEDI